MQPKSVPPRLPAKRRQSALTPLTGKPPRKPRFVVLGLTYLVVSVLCFGFVAVTATTEFAIAHIPTELDGTSHPGQAGVMVIMLIVAAFGWFMVVYSLIATLLCIRGKWLGFWMSLAGIVVLTGVSALVFLAARQSEPMSPPALMFAGVWMAMGFMVVLASVQFHIAVKQKRRLAAFKERQAQLLSYQATSPAQAQRPASGPGSQA